ncbi:hypothetical protein ACFVUH_03720 [Kitasatospora sp. NPDC058032]|uniref:hypothetical protein n=1 Tax=Kitasatospora sp. NPDC058032 TaxID=3346307 RepID=UPI0036D8EB82
MGESYGARMRGEAGPGGQNPAIAGAAIALPGTRDLAGTLPLPLGAAGHEGSTVIVGHHGLRLPRERASRRALRNEEDRGR